MKQFYLLTTILLLSTGIFAQTGFQTSYGDTTADFGNAILKNVNGNYVIVGTTVFHNVDSTEIAIYFIDPFGNLIGTATSIGLSGNEYPTSIVQAMDGNFIIAGNSYSSSLDTAGQTDIFITKVDSSSGSIIWSRFYGGDGEDKANAIITTPDGNYLIAGSTRAFGVFNQSALALKVDDNGDMLWCKITGIGIESDYVSATISAIDNTYILCGTTLDGNGSDHYITKMEDNGTTIWSNVVGSTSSEGSTSIYNTIDGGYAIGGYYIDPATLEEDQLITKLDTGGNYVWSKIYSTVREDKITSLIQNPSGNYFAAGYSNTDITGADIKHLTLMQTDPTGNIIWAYYYGDTTLVSEGSQVIFSIDSGLAVTGTTYGTGDPLGDAYFVKTDNDGESGCDENPFVVTVTPLTMNLTSAGFENFITPDTLSVLFNSQIFTDQFVQMCTWDGIHQTDKLNQIQLYPNPASGSVSIEGNFSGGFVTIYDRLGQSVLRQDFSGNKIQLNTSSFSAGLYFARISSGDSNITHKFIIQ
jgi:hypothetical protein